MNQHDTRPVADIKVGQRRPLAFQQRLKRRTVTRDFCKLWQSLTEPLARNQRQRLNQS
jgi:hypothetical protein